MQPDEMFIKGFTEPIAHLRMESPMFERFAIAPVVLLSVERIEAGLYVQTPVTCQAELRAGIKSYHCSPIWNIGLDPDGRTFFSGQSVLCVERQRDHKQEHHQDKFSHHTSYVLL